MTELIQIYSQDVVIANGQTVSAEFSLRVSNGPGKIAQLVGLQLPAALTGIAITFQRADVSGGTFVPVYNVDGASVYSVVVGTSRYVPLDPRVFAGIEFCKLVSGTAEGASRTVKAVHRAVS